jgi:hypothetical protein
VQLISSTLRLVPSVDMLLHAFDRDLIWESSQLPKRSVQDRLPRLIASEPPADYP